MEKRTSVDQLGRSVHYNFPPQRIVSLVPSQTELLFDLGLADRVVGITKFCVHPSPWLKTKTIVGGTKNFRFDVIDQLNPDLIIGNKEENYEEGIHQLQQKYPVWISDIPDWESAMQMICSVGEMVGEKAKADLLVREIQNKFREVKRFSPKHTLYLIWKSPYMAAGKNTFIDTMLSKIGLLNCSQQGRYPEFSVEEIKKLSPDLILLSSEPFPFRQQHIAELQQLLPKTKVLLVMVKCFRGMAADC